MVWVNDDGLVVKFGTEEADRGKGGIFTDKMYGDCTVYEFDIRAAELEPLVAFTSGGAATLTIGLYDTDRTTALDADGIDAAIALTAIDTVGEKVTCDGALVNTVLSNDTPCLVGATVGTAAYTAGRAKLRLYTQRVPTA